MGRRQSQRLEQRPSGQPQRTHEPVRVRVPIGRELGGPVPRGPRALLNIQVDLIANL